MIWLIDKTLSAHLTIVMNLKGNVNCSLKLADMTIQLMYSSHLWMDTDY